MPNLTLRVPDMSCGHCVASVTGAVEALDGVDEVEVDLESKEVSVAGPGFEKEAIAEAIREAGYEPEQP